MGASVDPIVAVQALALGDAGYPSTQIAVELGLKQRTVYDILDASGRWATLPQKPVLAKLRAEQQQRMEIAFRAASAVYLERSIDPEKLDKASTYQLAIAGKVSLEASRLLAGESTQIVDLHNHIDIEALDKLASALSLALMPQAIDVTPK